MRTGVEVTQKERLAGGVWGHLVGDAMGVPYEFLARKAVGKVVWGKTGTHQQEAGTWSDDGGLMLALLDSLLSEGFSLRDQGRKALAWWQGDDYKVGELFDIGNTTVDALRRLKEGAQPEWAGGGREEDNGNGALMRILPVALVGRNKSADEVAGEAMKAATLTHRHPKAQVTCALYALVAHNLLAGEEKTEALEEAQRSMERLTSGVYQQALEDLNAYSERKGSGYVLDSFWSAWEAFLGASSYAKCIESAIKYGNDTDTTACVAGGLGGIYWGVQGIPEAWRRGMRGKEIVEPLVARLVG